MKCSDQNFISKFDNAMRESLERIRIIMDLVFFGYFISSL